MASTQRDNASAPFGDFGLGTEPNLNGPLPGPNAQALIERDHRHCSPSNTRDYPLVVKRAAGAVVEDVDGNRFLDFAAGIAVCATGHCNPRVTAAIQEQAQSLIHICGSDFYYPPMVELMERLARIAPGGNDWRVYLGNSGAEAVEAAIKLSRYHTKRKWIIAFHGAFHGRTMGALSLTCSKAKQQERFGPTIPMVAHVPYGEVDAIEDQLFRYKMHPTEVAAIFVEALQGEGGYVIPPADFLPKLRALCDKHGILLVCDEIQSGTGRTGNWFAFERYNIVPDIILMAKGLASGMPLSAMVAREPVMDWEPGAQGSTYGGNPVCCAAALATLELVESSYMANAARLGEKLLAGLRVISEKTPAVTNIRGFGLMCAVDVVNPATGQYDAAIRERMAKGAFDKGLILLACGENSIRFCPPLCIDEPQLESGLRLFGEAAAGAV